MHQILTYEPRVVQIYEMFEERLQDDFVDDVLTEAACMATAVYFFDPPDDEIELYATFIMYRVEEWYEDELI